MRKLLASVLAITFLVSPLTSLQSCASKKEIQIDNFVNGYLSANLFFTKSDKGYKVVTNTTLSNSKGQIYFLEKNLIDNNKEFLDMLKVALVPEDGFIKQWNNLLNILQTKLCLKIIHTDKRKFVDFSNVKINGGMSWMSSIKEGENNSLSWNIDLGITNGSKYCTFVCKGNFTYKNWI